MTDPFHFVVLFAILTSALTLIYGQYAIRRLIRVRRTQPPEYWRMYARVCDARADRPPRELQRVPDIDDRR